MKTTVEHQLCGVVESGEARGITGGVGVCAVSRSKDFVIEDGLAAKFSFYFILLCVANVCSIENAWMRFTVDRSSIFLEAEFLWLMASKEEGPAGDVPAAREVLERGFVADRDQPDLTGS